MALDCYRLKNGGSAESEALEPESIFTPVKGEVDVPAFMPASADKTAPQAHDLGEILPAPVAITVDTLPKNRDSS
ncbi:hypothetical protein [Polynucleobacter sphagniphilus]|uniref:hypothetical protein n=1 Tax=Polynucleobacter sphagniphilus TaxID=1743169 RepID=UPI0024733E92|nr:hypothetical protein [Polynucleobacter sphagniphilus]MDH6248336.1 hypothetical protein [Polynucleobacter sphagniphilus]MDH6300852.1 hypothetical protein [Polynucleobacter sphagniphilus]